MKVSTDVPPISVIVPVHNGEATIGACVESLLRLDYPREQLEIIVVDNRSTDRTRDILNGYPIRVLAEDDVQSSYAARNRGIAASSGDTLAFTDADCVADRGWLRGIVRAIASDGVGGVAGYLSAFRNSSPVERYQAERSIRSDRAFTHPVMPFAQTANAAYRRTVFERIGGFDPAIVFGGDLDFSWRMQRETGLKLVYEACALVWHQHRTSSHGLFKLYEKNAIANCLLAQRYEHYAAYPRARTLLYLAREASWSSLRAAWQASLSRREQATVSYFDTVCYVGAMAGWLRWHAQSAARPARSTSPGWGPSKVLPSSAAAAVKEPS